MEPVTKYVVKIWSILGIIFKTYSHFAITNEKKAFCCLLKSELLIYITISDLYVDVYVSQRIITCDTLESLLCMFCASCGYAG